MKRMTITQLEKKYELTPATIAKKCGVHLATVYRMRSGEIDPYHSTVERIERGLGLKPGTVIIEAPEAA